MFKKSIIALTVATIAATSLSSAAFAGNHKHFGGWNKHHNNAYFAIKVTKPHYYPSGCYKYKKLYKATHKKIWWKKYKACLILKY